MVDCHNNAREDVSAADVCLFSDLVEISILKIKDILKLNL